MAIAASFPAIRPSLLLDFANVGALDPRVTFSRSTTATYYDGVTTAKAEENLLLYSQEFNNAIWTKNDASVTANATTAPDSTLTADKLIEAATTAIHTVRQTITTIAATHIYSVYLKAAERTFALLRYGNSDGITVNLTTGVASLDVGSVSSITSTDAGGGWWRVSFAVTTLAAAGSFRIYVSTDGIGANASYAGDGTSGIFVWGAQLEQRSSVTAYTPTTTQPITNYIPVLQTAAAGVPRFDHNPTTGEALGLLIEEARTNLLTWSESFRTQTLAVTGVTGTFVDGETVTATGGGTGAYVLAESTGASFAIFNGSGTFTGTLTGGTSGATATISSSVANWTKTVGSVQANTVIAPDGSLTADTFVDGTTSGVPLVYGSHSFTSGTTNTLSVFAKDAGRRYLILWGGSGFGSGTASFDLQNGTIVSTTNAVSSSITPVGNGWYRCTLTDTSSSTLTSNVGVQLSFDGSATSYTGDGYSGVYIWGAQLEAGAFPTSFVKTVASQVTRNADAASMTGTNFSSWYRADEGTLFADASTFSPSSGAVRNVFVLSINGNTSAETNRIFTYAGKVGGSTTFNGVLASDLQPFTYALGSVFKFVYGYKTNNFVALANGGAALSDLIGNVPTTINQADIGGTGGSSIMNGHIRKLAYYPQRLTNANLQALTA